MYNGELESFREYFDSITASEIEFSDLSTRLDNIANGHNQFMSNSNPEQNEGYTKQLGEYKTLVKKFYHTYNRK